MISGFNWIVDKKIAGSALPGLYGDHDSEIEFLKDCGVTHIVSLVEDNVAETFGDDFDYYHYPIDDMGIPDLKRTKVLIREIKGWVDNEKVVLFHCKAGLGRTGTLLACYLIDTGMSSEEAIKHLRSINRGYIQSTVQMRFLGQYGLLP